MLKGSRSNIILIFLFSSRGHFYFAFISLLSPDTVNNKSVQYTNNNNKAHKNLY